MIPLLQIAESISIQQIKNPLSGNMKYLLAKVLFLFCAGTACAQTDPFTASLQQDLDRYYQFAAPQNIRLFFNQPQYATGDTVFYSVRVNAFDHSRSATGRMILAIRIIAASGSTILTQKVLVKDGVGYNQFAVGDVFKGGVYQVTVYTDAMIGSDPSSVATYPILINGTRNGRQLQDRVSMQFFPEGGYMVEGATNRIIVRGPADTEGAIIDIFDNHVASFRLNAQGYGVAYLKPQGDRKYFGVSGNRKYELPAATFDNISLMVSLSKDRSSVKVIGQMSPRSTLMDSVVRVVVSKDNNITYAANVKFDKTNRSLLINIPAEKFLSGLNHISLFSDHRTVLADRLIYFNEQREGSPLATLAQAKDQLAIREDGQLSIDLSSLRDKLTRPLAVTIYSEDLMSSRARTVLYENPILTTDSVAEEVRDAYWITQTVPQRWTNIFNCLKSPDKVYNENIFIRGHLFHPDREKRLEDSIKVCFFLLRDVMAYEIYPDKNGYFNFPLLLSFYGDDEVVYHIERKNKVLRDYKVRLKQDAVVPYRLHDYEFTNSPDRYFTFNDERRIIDSAYAVKEMLRVVASKREESPTAFLEDEIFGVDHKIVLTDYLLFPNMEETIREVIPALYHRWNNDDHVLRVIIEDLEFRPYDTPAMIIDGVMTDDVNYFMSLRPEDVYAIKIVTKPEKLTRLGSIANNGLVIVETKILNNALNVPKCEQIFMMSGLNPATGTFVLNRGSARPRVPDLRSCLYWNPALTLNQAGTAAVEFRTGDVTGKFVVEVRGLTADGNDIKLSKTFTVGFDGKPN
jgi:hypothetical protein